MSFYAFCLLSPLAQFYWVIKHGTYLAQRRDGEQGIALYYCTDEGRGFLVEVGDDKGLGRTGVLRSFECGGPLEDYGHGVQLPE